MSHSAEEMMGVVLVSRTSAEKVGFIHAIEINPIRVEAGELSLNHAHGTLPRTTRIGHDSRTRLQCQEWRIKLS